MKRFTVTGMSCAACSARVEKQVRSLAGTEDCAVNLLTGDLTVKGTVTEEEVIRAVTDAGYGCRICGEAGTAENSSKAGVEPDIHRETAGKLKKRFLLSLIFLLPLVYVSMGAVMAGLPLPGAIGSNPFAVGLTELLLSSAVLVLNCSFFISGVKGFMHRTPNMDSLVSLGSGISWIWSVTVLYQMFSAVETSFSMAEALTAAECKLHSLYFESAAMILVLITLGKMLEAGTKGKTTDAVRKLRDLRPQTARLLTEQGERIVSASEIRKGDRFLLKPGDAVPADGIVLEGSSAVNESMLTGESLPAEKHPAEKNCRAERENRVYAATVNVSGNLICSAEATGEETALSQIIRMVTEASATKAPVARLADLVAAYFVPGVLLISMVTFAAWLLSGSSAETALRYAISVLVISCPCALGLATPVAIMVGSGVGARNGILFKSAEALEQTGKVKTAVFDKTGTVTLGRPVLTELIPGTDTEEIQLLKAAVSLEQYSEHPLAAALLDYGKQKGIGPEEISGFREDGSAVYAVYQGAELAAGGRRLLEEFGIQLEEDEQKAALRLEETGKTVIYILRDRSLFGMAAFSDTLRSGTAEAVKGLKELGIRTVMLTGDVEAAAKAAADSAGIEKVISGVLPSEKAEMIRELKKDGMVLMVGDGINDAPALAEADIGMAVAAGTDIAMDACDVVLMKSDPGDVPAAVRLSRSTLRNIRQNLFWAFFYNLLCIPLAAGVWENSMGISLTPMIGAAAMSCSSLFVVSNALRLNFCRIYPESKKSEVSTMEQTITIRGMMCPHCEARVKTALEAVPGVTEATVSHEKGNAVVGGTAERSLLVKAVIDAGYEAE